MKSLGDSYVRCNWQKALEGALQLSKVLQILEYRIKST